MRRSTLFPAAMLVLVTAIPARAEVWVSHPAPTTADLYGVAALDANRFVAVGAGGTILSSTDGGSTWSTIPSPAKNDLRAVSFRADTGLATGVSGEILRSSDGGLTWTASAPPTGKTIWGVAMGESVDVIVSEEGRILVSNDRGVTWALKFSALPTPLLAAACNGGRGVVGGASGALIVSTDIGGFWMYGAPAGFGAVIHGVSMPTVSRGWAVGTDLPASPGLILRTDGPNLIWTAQPSPSPHALFGVSFAAADTGSAVGDTGTAVHTDNGGATWVVEPTGTLAPLNAIAYADTRHGVAVGNLGTILVSSGGVVAGVGSGGAGAARLGVRVLGSRSGEARTSRLALDLPAEADVELRVLDVTGRVVATVARGRLAAGTHEFAWSGRTDAGAPAWAGMYFVQARAGGAQAVAKLAILE